MNIATPWPLSGTRGRLFLLGYSKVEHLGFRREVNQMGPPVEHHVGEEFRLVQLTSIGTRNSDSNGDFIFDQIRQIIIGAIARDGLDIEIPC